MKMNEILHKERTEQKSNYLSMDFRAISENESLARVVVTGFVSELDPTLEELSDIKTAVSEAVTNAIIHGYAGNFVDPLVHLVWAWQMWKKPCSRFTQASLNWKDPVWVSPLWKHLWMICRWSQHREKAPK